MNLLRVHCELCPAGEKNAGWKFLYTYLQVRGVRKAENKQMLCRLQVKGHIKKHNKEFTLSAVKDLTCEGFWKVGPEHWRKNISHVRNKLEDH